MTRITVVHERWTEQGGSENVARALVGAWPDARLHVAFADPRAVPADLRGRIAVTGLDRVHRALGRRSHAPLIPLAPAAWRLHRADPGADAVVISHHAMAVSAARTWPDARVVAYVHSPARWAWMPELRAGEGFGAPGRLALAALAAQTRAVETAAVPHLDVVIANSTAVARRIERWWHVPAQVVAPPVDVARFTPDGAVPGDYFLVAGRLVPYRRVDLAIRAARRAGVRLVVAGDGRHEAALRRIAGEETVFLGRVTDAEMVRLQREAIATIMPGEEDFGIVPVEAMATGTPVVARAAGGALDTVVPGVSGVLVPDGADEAFTDALAAAMRDLRPADFDPAVLRAHAEGFSVPAFQARMRAIVEARR
ncbi:MULTISPECIES: glycosyltransferase [Tsukamurella]|uniref:Glycosyltransferase family 4 protein n=2 Tax=Tsukamurella TaxID=2060 RepID=A0A5C5RZ19_9ACTN|nr:MULTISPECIES: glycosyltransferase [Tsukamurella]NMD54109.1 glycosyltransferase family 4 protein [Tsukamurella columbiensis]TWS28357.1 glycosyltransferase family 4 protein [Tsukamurella conjunctivitidis]